MRHILPEAVVEHGADVNGQIRQPHQPNGGDGGIGGQFGVFLGHGGAPFGRNRIGNGWRMK
jgi:hypothetical protein